MDSRLLGQNNNHPIRLFTSTFQRAIQKKDTFLLTAKNILDPPLVSSTHVRNLEADLDSSNASSTPTITDELP